MKCVDCSYHDICAEWTTDKAFVGFPYVYEGDEKPCGLYTTDKLEFVKSVKEHPDYVEKMTWYRTLFHDNAPNTDKGIMAQAVNDLFYKLDQTDNK